MSESDVTTKSSAAKLSESEIKEFLNELNVNPESNLIGLLQEVQERFGFLPQPAIHDISRLTRIPLSRVYGVVSFYAQFYTEPRGKHTIRACRGTACHVKGAARVLDAIRRILGISENETTEDMLFSFETVACLGACALSPVMLIDNIYYGKTTPRRVEEVLERLIAEETGEEAAR